MGISTGSDTWSAIQPAGARQWACRHIRHRFSVRPAAVRGVVSLRCVVILTFFRACVRASSLPGPRAGHTAPCHGEPPAVHLSRMAFAGIPPDDLLAAQVRLPASSVVLHNGTVVAHLGRRAARCRRVGPLALPLLGHKQNPPETPLPRESLAGPGNGQCELDRAERSVTERRKPTHARSMRRVSRRRLHGPAQPFADPLGNRRDDAVAAAAVAVGVQTERKQRVVLRTIA